MKLTKDEAFKFKMTIASVKKLTERECAHVYREEIENLAELIELFEEEFMQRIREEMEEK